MADLRHEEPILSELELTPIQSPIEREVTETRAHTPPVHRFESDKREIVGRTQVIPLRRQANVDYDEDLIEKPEIDHKLVQEEI